VKIATHKNGCQIYYFSEWNHLAIYVLSSEFIYRKEHLENGRTLCIAECLVFERYLGVGQNKASAGYRSRRAVSRFLLRLVEEQTLRKYLSDKGFEFSKWAGASEKPFSCDSIHVMSYGNREDLNVTV